MQLKILFDGLGDIVNSIAIISYIAVDSYYKYLLEQWIQRGRKENDFLLNDYIRSTEGIFSKLLKRTPKDNHVYIGELIDAANFKPKMDHLTHFLPGTLLLDHHFGLPDSSS
uniref:alpha-1,2-Mannosidase n=1 Tax=Glossina morsitans morsitans TaxID=37546 RepID=A0A1B0GER3_GLOMM